MGKGRRKRGTAGRSDRTASAASSTGRVGPAPSSGSSPTTDAWRALLSTSRLSLIAALLALNAATFSAVRSYPFADLDDPQYVSENPHVAQGLTLESVTWAFTEVHASYWIPVNWLSHMVDVELYGLHAGGHHLTNVLLHSVNAVLLFALLFLATGATGRSALVAALFAVHPLHVESVVWVTERKDVLSTLFWLLTTWAYVRYVARPGPLRYGLVCVALILGLMTKPMLVTVPFALLLVDVWPLRRIRLDAGESKTRGREGLLARLWPLVREKGLLFAIAGVWIVITLATQWEAVPALDTISLPDRLANAVVSYGAYLVKTVWPHGLALFYPYPEGIPAWKVGASALVLLAITTWTVRSAPVRPYALVGWLWFLGILLPVSGIVQAGHQAMADRFTYVPLIGIFVIAAWGGYELLRRAHAKLPAVVGAVVVVSAAIAARNQVAVWETNEGLWRHALESGHASYVAHTNLGIALQEQGDSEAAIPHYRAALEMRPDYSEARNNLAVALANRGEVDEAIRQFREAARFDPDQAAVHRNLGVLLAGRGDTAAAVQHLREALSLDPGFQEARADLNRLIPDSLTRSQNR